MCCKIMRIGRGKIICAAFLLCMTAGRIEAGPVPGDGNPFDEAAKSRLFAAARTPELTLEANYLRLLRESLAKTGEAETTDTATMMESDALAVTRETMSTTTAIDVAGSLPTWQEGTNVVALSEVVGIMRQAIEVAALLPATPPPQPVAVKEKPLTAAELKNSRGLNWPVIGNIYSTFGASRGRRGHGAIDIVAPKNTPIVAAAFGKVIVVANGGKLFRGYGKTVIIDHGNGVHTLYSHCNSMLVKMGQNVKKGEPIATVGRTGRASTDHCHFEVRVDGKKRDPLTYLPEKPELVKGHNWRSSKKAN